MQDSQLLEKLEGLLGSLEPSNQAEQSELVKLQETLALSLRDHPNLSITGNPFSDLASSQPTVDDAKLRQILQTANPYSSPTPEPLIFRRETPYRSDFLATQCLTGLWAGAQQKLWTNRIVARLACLV
jgi:hypothetical protein